MLTLLWVTVLYPLLVAWRANRQTTLRPAVAWAVAAWISWLALVLADQASSSHPGLPISLVRYLPLCLTCCAGVSVLGSRRPGVTAWNLVVVGGLLAVLLLPVAHGLGQPRLHPAHLLFLSIALAVIVLNYLPTRLGLAAALFGFGCALQIVRLAGGTVPDWLLVLGSIAQAAAPWLALLLSCWGAETDPFDRTWCKFRDRFGLLWSLRVREQINRAADNAGWGMELGWSGQQGTSARALPDPAEALALLKAVLRRFGPPESSGEQKTN